MNNIRPFTRLGRGYSV